METAQGALIVNMTRGVQTLRWRDDVLEMVDQRILPARFEYLRFDRAASVAEGIRTMVVRGAPAIGVAAAYGVVLEARRLSDRPAKEFDESLCAGFEVLASSSACPCSTIDVLAPSGEDIPIEERDPMEVTGFRSAQWAAEGVRVRNPSFDITPADLVTALITERGVIYSPNNVKLCGLFH